VDDELARIRKEGVVAESRYYATIAGLRKITKYFSLDSQCPARDLSWHFPNTSPESCYYTN
jgi:hypothetical protein